MRLSASHTCHGRVMGRGLEPAVGRRTWRTMEAYHGAIYFVPEAGEEYAKVGLEPTLDGV